MAQYLVHTETKREFQVVRLDKANGQITLKGPNTEFTEPYNKEQFKANGYTLVTRDDPPPKAKPKPAPEPEEEDEDEGEDDHED